MLSSTISFVSSICDLSVVIDSRLRMAAWPRRSVCYHPRQIRSRLQSLSEDVAKMLVQAFISIRLEYCNAVLYIRRHQQLVSATGVSTECSSQADNANRSSTHHSCSEADALAAYPTSGRFQAHQASRHCYPLFPPMFSFLFSSISSLLRTSRSPI